MEFFSTAKMGPKEVHMVFPYFEGAKSIIGILVAVAPKFQKAVGVPFHDGRWGQIKPPPPPFWHGTVRNGANLTPAPLPPIPPFLASTDGAAHGP